MGSTGSPGFVNAVSRVVWNTAELCEVLLVGSHAGQIKSIKCEKHDQLSRTTLKIL